MIPVVMSGGSGTRLWPYSRKLYPKQLLPVVDESSTMLQATLSRLDGLDGLAEPIVVCNEEHRFIVAEQLRQEGVAQASIVLEPFGRNTAPAIAVAAIQAKNLGQSDQVLLVLAADHVITQEAAFHQAIEVANKAAKAGELVTFGIVPTHPETGFGYIQRGAQASSEGVYGVSQFVEKPSAEIAKGYVDSGEYYWNSGMFMFTAERYLAELAKHAPDMLAACEKAVAGEAPDLDFIRLDRDAFAACPDDSVDYAVMEKADNVVVVPLDAGWSDVGSWTGVWDVCDKDEQGNVLKGDVIAKDTRNCYVQGERKLVTTLGLTNVAVVETDDAILVADMAKVQDVKSIVADLKAADRNEANLHRKVYRPWGYYDSIDSGERFQVKRIVVKPGAQLSLQMHHHRAEHWIVVSGTALVTNGDKDILLTENQSTYIPLGVKHRLENPGAIDLELIEVQSGSYLGEDDIVRFEDNYGRS